MSTSLYDRDLAEWSTQQGDALRRRAGNEIDWDNVAEEIEDLSRAQRRQLGNRIATILEHLIRMQISSSVDPRAGWRRTIVKSRIRIRKLLTDSPSLRPAVPVILTEELPAARQLALLALEEYGETPRIDPNTLDYTEDQVLGDWFP